MIPAEFNVRITIREQTAIVELPAPDPSAVRSTSELAKALREWALAQRPGRVVLDSTGLQTLTSALLGLMADLCKHVRAGGGTVRVAGLSPRLVPVFRMTRLDQLFSFHETVDEAVAAFGG